MRRDEDFTNGGDLESFARKTVETRYCLIELPSVLPIATASVEAMNVVTFQPQGQKVEDKVEEEEEEDDDL